MTSIAIDNLFFLVGNNEVFVFNFLRRVPEKLHVSSIILSAYVALLQCDWVAFMLQYL